MIHEEGEDRAAAENAARLAALREADAKSPPKEATKPVKPQHPKD